jgi:hypothetical protein
VGEKFRGFGQKGGVDIENGRLPLFCEAGGFREEEGAGYIFPLWIGIGKMGSDIARAERSKNCVRESMKKDIGIRVTLEAPFVGDGHATEDKGASRDERMDIVTKTYA